MPTDTNTPADTPADTAAHVNADAYAKAKANANANAKAPVAVTVLGLGAMGRALAGAFLDAGHPTTVWNRTPGRDTELVARGALSASDPAEAVRACELVVVCVVDYDAVRRILEPLAAALEGRVLVNLTSDTPDRSRETAAWAAEHSVAYLDGAVMVPTTFIGAPEALILYAGSRTAFDSYESTLRALGGKAVHLGADHGMAALYDLSLLDFFYASMSGLVHAFALAGADGVRAADLVPYLRTIADIMPPIAESMADQIDRGDYTSALGGLGMMAVSVDHILHAARDRGLDVSLHEAVKSVADRAIAKGHAADNWSSTIEAVRPR